MSKAKKPAAKSKPAKAPAKKVVVKKAPTAKKPAPAPKKAAVKVAKPVPQPRKDIISRPRIQAGPVLDIDNLNTSAPIKTTYGDGFLKKQKEKLLQLRDALLDQIHDVAQESVREKAVESSGLGMHQGDAGSEAYDRDFALTILSQEQDALYEIEEAIKRVELKTYGMCEMSQKPIPQARLEAIPFARFTVECQAQIEKQMRNRNRWTSETPFAEIMGRGEEDSEEDYEKEER